MGRKSGFAKEACKSRRHLACAGELEECAAVLSNQTQQVQVELAHRQRARQLQPLIVHLWMSRGVDGCTDSPRPASACSHRRLDHRRAAAAVCAACPAPRRGTTRTWSPAAARQDCAISHAQTQALSVVRRSSTAPRNTVTPSAKIKPSERMNCVLSTVSRNCGV